LSGRSSRKARLEVRTLGLPTAMTLSVLVAGCLLGPDYKRPRIDPPEGFKSQTVNEEAPLLAPEWWRLYGEPELDRLIATANDSNQTVKQAVAAVDQARALARVAGSFRYPTISVGLTYARQQTSGSRRSNITGEPVQAVAFNDWLLPFDLSYEIDAWGRVRRTLESARAQAVASADDEAMIRLTVQTDVAQFYYTLRSLDTQAEVLAQTVDSYREQVRLLSVQLKTGLVSAIVVRQAEAQLETTLAQRHDVVRQRADQEHALAVLCGQPAPVFAIAPNPLREASPPDVPAGLPAALLARRPDVASAEQQVVATNASIGAATAEFYPQFTLSSTAGWESANLRNLLDWRSRLATIVPGVTLPIFQGGRLKANLEAVQAQHRQAVAVYVNQVLIAYADVEDALTDLHALIDIVSRYRGAVDASQNYLRLAQVQYKTGLADYLLVIDAERTLLANQLSLVQAVNLQQAASIRLIKALGGGWDDSRITK
jgi:outer membrane protein, multidrug efflux system